jgi:FdhD protein
MGFPQETLEVQMRRFRRTGGDAFDAESRTDTVLVEEPLRIVVDDCDVALLLRTPGRDQELAVGFALTEGIVDAVECIASVKQCPVGEKASGPVYPRAGCGLPLANVVRLEMVDGAVVRLPSFREVRSSCSLCGAEEIDTILRQGSGTAEVCANSAADEHWPPEDLIGLTECLQSHQPLFRATGAAHGAAVVDRDGNVLALGEDIGRHNALDKALGALVWGGAMRPGLAIALSSRLSFEMALKVWRSGIRNVAAVSAPSSLAIEFSRRAGLQVAAFARGDRLNLYSPVG